MRTCVCLCCCAARLKPDSDRDSLRMPKFRSLLGVLASAESRLLLALHCMRRPSGASPPLDAAAGSPASLCWFGDAVLPVPGSSGHSALVVRDSVASASAGARNRVSQHPYPSEVRAGVMTMDCVPIVRAEAAEQDARLEAARLQRIGSSPHLQTAYASAFGSRHTFHTVSSCAGARFAL